MDVFTPNRKALVLGASGLIGTELVSQLCDHKQYSEIIIAGRTKPGIENTKIRFKQVDMTRIFDYPEVFEADDIFCCLGTTIKKAGSQEKFREVDYHMIVNSAKAAEGKCKSFVLISSIGANKDSSNFYLKTKGETENDVLACNIPSISILRPSILYGNRKEKRLGEKLGIMFMKLIQPLMIGSLKKYRGNHAENVARAMILYALENKAGKHIYISEEFEKKVKTA